MMHLQPNLHMKSTDENFKTFNRVVKPIDETIELKILKLDEKFILEDKFYTNPDDSIILRSTHITGKLIRPEHGRV